MTTISAREFNQDVSAAKREAKHRPVIITDRGQPAFVLLSIEEYRRLSSHAIDLVERLSMAEESDVDFEPVELELKVPTL